MAASFSNDWGHFMSMAAAPARAADAAFQQFLQSLRPQAEQLGISRATFDVATRDLAGSKQTHDWFGKFTSGFDVVLALAGAG